MTTNQALWRSHQHGGPITHCFPDYSGTLTSNHDDVDPQLGMRPIHAATLATIWELHAAGVVLGLVSNTTEGQDRRRALQAAGVASLFENRVYLSHELGLNKRNSLFYRHILNDLGLNPGELMVCGNRIDADVRVPAAMGIRAVLLGPTETRAQLPTRATLITTIGDLPDILKGASRAHPR
ncbi:HAD family hydrolase [Actinomadura syzygii]|nr:HAD hydrolase-like protein [Actinomadura syzygii]